MNLFLGERIYDLSRRALVMGILNRTPDSFYDRGEYWDADAFWKRAERLVDEGADVLDVGGVKAGPGPEVNEAEELERVIRAVEGLRQRFDLPVSVDTWRAAVAVEAFRAGAVMGNDISGFADPGYLPAASAAGATVVATHIRLKPRVPDPDPVYTDVVEDVRRFLDDRASRAEAAGVHHDRILVDAGLDLGKTVAQSRQLLLASDRLAQLGYSVLLSASNKKFLGGPVEGRADATNAAHAIGVTLGCRVVRAHDVRAARRVCDTLAAVEGSAVGGQGGGAG